MLAGLLLQTVRGPQHATELSWLYFFGNLIVQRRVLLFIVLSLGILVGNAYLQMWLKERNAPPIAEQDAAADAKAKKEAAEKKAAKEKADAKAKNEAAKNGEAAAAQAEKQPGQAAPEPVIEEQYFSLGSADPDSPYRMVATLTNRGAALERVELNEPRYLQLEERHGYLGYLAPIDAPEGGCLVRIVGKGTPAEIAGVQAGDVITRLGEIEINDATGLSRNTIGDTAWAGC